MSSSPVVESVVLHLNEIGFGKFQIDLRVHASGKHSALINGRPMIARDDFPDEPKPLAFTSQFGRLTVDVEFRTSECGDIIPGCLSITCNRDGETLTSVFEVEPQTA